MFFDLIFAKEVDIFKGFILDWEAMKRILKGIFEGVQELKSFSILDVLDSVISRVAWVVVATKKSGTRVDWLDRVIDEIRAQRGHSVLAP